MARNHKHCRPDIKEQIECAIAEHISISERAMERRFSSHWFTIFRFIAVRRMSVRIFALIAVRVYCILAAIELVPAEFVIRFSLLSVL
jgi:hypothetical protein